ncbi:MAG: hypothetical protein WA790_16140 [Sulfitobacter sp.]
MPDYTGTSGNNLYDFNGLIGGETIDGLGGQDTIDGSSNNNNYLYDLENNVISLTDGSFAATLLNFEEVIGGNGDDIIIGCTTSAIYNLDGGEGDDTVSPGSAGNDQLWGNFNADTFVFTAAFGQDTVMDFDANNNFERIDLSGATTITDFTDLINNHANQVGSNVFINAHAGNTILLMNVNLADLDNIDFIF